MASAVPEREVLAALGLEQLDYGGKERVVRAREDRKAHGVDVFLNGRAHDLLGGLVETGVNDLMPGVAQRPGDDFRPPVMTIEAGFGDENA